MLNFAFWGLLGGTVSCLYSLLRVLFVTGDREFSLLVNLNRIITGIFIGLSIFFVLLSRYESKTILYFEILVFLVIFLYFILVFIENIKIEKISISKYLETILLTITIGLILFKSIQYILY